MFLRSENKYHRICCDPCSKDNASDIWRVCIPYLTLDTNAYINGFLTLAALFPIVALLCEKIKIINCFEVEMWFLYNF